jgi:hypothetical protein
LKPDLFEAGEPGPAKPAAIKTRPPLHSDTDIYRAVTELARFATLAAADMRRDVKPLIGRILVEETIYMGVMVLRANKAPAAEKASHFEELLEQTEVVQMTLRLARECRYLPNAVFTESLPLTASVAKQATALRNHFAPAP